MNILLSDFITGILIFVRILSLFLVAPFFNNESFPRFIKAITALAITYIIFMIVPRVNVPVNISFLWLFFMGLKEVLTGVIMGFTLELIFYGISFAGFLLSHEIGLMMADMFDPNSQASENILGLLLVFMGTVIFVIIGGHRFIIESLAYSFKIIPIGKMSFNGAVTEALIKYSSSIFVIGLKIASPLIVAFFFVHVASGIISRVSPTFQVFFVLLPLKIGLGLFLMILLFPIFGYAFRDLFYEYNEKLLEMLKIMAQ